MKILITGVAGFIGFNLAKRLLNEGNHVVGIDNLMSGQLKNVQYLEEFENFEFYLADIRTSIDFLYNDFDEIYNFACPASPAFYQKSPRYTIETCTLGMKNILTFSGGRSLVLQASTSEVYGDPLSCPQSEEYKGNVQTIGPRACYDEGKRIAETIIYEYNKEYNNCRIIRIFNTYGPGMRKDDGRVVSNFINQALHNQDITIYGKGDQTRSFQYIDDLIDGTIAMMRNDENFFGPVNIGTPFEFTILELAELVLKLIPGSKSKLVFQELPQDDPKQRRANNNLAKEKLGRSPKIGLEEGLKRTIDYFKTI